MKITKLTSLNAQLNRNPKLNLRKKKLKKLKLKTNNQPLIRLLKKYQVGNLAVLN